MSLFLRKESVRPGLSHLGEPGDGGQVSLESMGGLGAQEGRVYSLEQL